MIAIRLQIALYEHELIHIKSIWSSELSQTYDQMTLPSCGTCLCSSPMQHLCQSPCSAGMHHSDFNLSDGWFCSKHRSLYDL